MSGRSAAWYRACLGRRRSRVQISAPRPKHLACFLQLIESAVHPTPHLWNSGRQEFSIRKSFRFREFGTCRICKNTRRQECYSETIERTQVNRPRSGKYGENSGDPTHFLSNVSYPVGRGTERSAGLPSPGS